jgi:hypothetical protein
VAMVRIWDRETQTYGAMIYNEWLSRLQGR